MTEEKAKELVNKKFPNRKIDNVEKHDKGFIVSAYDPNVGPMDISGGVFLVGNSGNVKQLSVTDMFNL